MTGNSHILESLPAYVLGSLNESEARLVAEHLAGCHLCRTELRAFQNTADQLAWAAPAALPSEDLKRRFVERLETIKSSRPHQENFRSQRRLLPVGGLIAAIVIFALLASNLILWQRFNSLEVLAGPMGMRAITLQNTASAPGASGFVIISSDGLEGVLVVDELPMLDTDHEYQLWLEDEETTSGAVFLVDESGYRGLRIEAPQSLLLYSSVRITVEPAGGSDSPTGDTVLEGSLFNP